MSLVEEAAIIPISHDGVAWPYWVAGFLSSWASAWTMPEYAPEQAPLMLGVVTLLFLWGLVRSD